MLVLNHCQGVTMSKACGDDTSQDEISSGTSLQQPYVYHTLIGGMVNSILKNTQFDSTDLAHHHYTETKPTTVQGNVSTNQEMDEFATLASFSFHPGFRDLTKIFRAMDSSIASTLGLDGKGYYPVTTILATIHSHHGTSLSSREVSECQSVSNDVYVSAKCISDTFDRVQLCLPSVRIYSDTLSEESLNSLALEMPGEEDSGQSRLKTHCVMRAHLTGRNGGEEAIASSPETDIIIFYEQLHHDFMSHSSYRYGSHLPLTYER